MRSINNGTIHPGEWKIGEATFFFRAISDHRLLSVGEDGGSLFFTQGAADFWLWLLDETFRGQQNREGRQ